MAFAKDFKHVFAFAQVANAVQVINYRYHTLDVHLRHHPLGMGSYLPAEYVALDFSAQGGVVVRIDYDVDHRPIFFALSNSLSTCVSVCKCLLGVTDWFITPDGFYRWLLRNGGTVLDEARQGEILAVLQGQNDSLIGGLSYGR